MNRIKSILIVLSFLLSFTSFSQHYVRILHIMNDESVIDTYILPTQLDSITFHKINLCNIEAIPAEPGMGRVVVSQSSVREGEMVSLTAISELPYKFKSWSLNGVEVSTDNPYTIQLNEDSKYIANFEYDPYAGKESVAVDLGLPSGLKWASYNLGATSLEQVGDYFMWGETFPRTYFGNMVDNINTYTDNPDVLPLSADAANVIWGGDWRMPTKEEWAELLDSNYCTWSDEIVNGVVVRCVKSKKNGNKLYLPYPGYGVGSLIEPTGSGWYWTSTNSDQEDKSKAYTFYLSSAVNEYSSPEKFIDLNLTKANRGQVIRPVIK